MKNIHVLPTEKPSRLHLAFNKTFILSVEFTNENKLYQSIPHNIYITSDEEIKEGDWFLEKAGRQYPIQWNGIEKLNFHCKKIILTTDQDLIKDGVQAIDDEFLEWFVKNPSCEQVEIKSWIKTCEDGSSFNRMEYEIIIPKEEPKQETLEEAAERLSQDYKGNLSEKLIAKTFIIVGAKWQQERMYSEEEVIKILLARNADLGIIGKTSAVVEFIKQFKKK